MNSIEIRPLADADLPALVAVWNRALTQNPLTLERFARIVLADPDYWPGADSGFLVAVRHGQVVGFLRAIIRRHPNDRLGLEPEDGWMPYFAVDPAAQRHGSGTALLQAALDYFTRHHRRRVWVCGTPTSAPGSLFPGVDTKTQAPARALLEKHGFVVDQHGFSMSRAVVDFDVAAFAKWAWETGPEIRVEPLTPPYLTEFFEFLATGLPGSWNLAAREKVRAGGLGEMLIARRGDRLVGYCQWSGEHFGPFGVDPAIRQQRVGAKLFTEAVRRIRAADGRTVWFNWADERARHFYDRFGLHVTREFAVLRKTLDT